MADFMLTTGNDTVVAPASGSTVYADAATLNDWLVHRLARWLLPASKIISILFRYP
jgi:hypothetical protein